MRNFEAEIARIEERLTAQENRIDRTEVYIERSVSVARAELERRLDILNHAHENALRDRAQFVTRAEIRWMVGTMVVLSLALLGYLIRRG